ncbi:protein FAM185A [Hypomesus transpacificus]|uniref:protein FAM185A n=1 Tax=Hypomesus transpacificus TaxID=137520 RepID=UPI001F076A87|nr:protein FAM185A [Hypomesus transpacificus]
MLWYTTTLRVCFRLVRWKPRQKTLPNFTFQHTSRTLSTSPCASTPYEINKPLKQWTLVVNPFSKVRAQLTCSISIRPLDPHAFPESNRAFITVHGTSADQGIKLDNVHVHYDDQSKELLILSEKVNSNMSVELTAPVKSDLYITAKGEGNVRVENMECDVCKVQTERGNCVLHSVKAHRVEVRTQGGAITCGGTIHGNVDISATGDGAVDMKKVQGTVLGVATERGPLKIKAIYAENILVSSSSGPIQLGHVHGNASVRSEAGDIVVDSSSSHLHVSSLRGDVDAYVGESGTAELSSLEGSVCVRVPASSRAGLRLRGGSVELSPEVTLQEAACYSKSGQTHITGFMNQPQDGQWIDAQTDRGTVRVKTQSWFESLKLGS